MSSIFWSLEEKPRLELAALYLLRGVREREIGHSLRALDLTSRYLQLRQGNALPEAQLNLISALEHTSLKLSAAARLETFGELGPQHDGAGREPETAELRAKDIMDELRHLIQRDDPDSAFEAIHQIAKSTPQAVRQLAVELLGRAAEASTLHVLARALRDATGDTMLFDLTSSLPTDADRLRGIFDAFSLGLELADQGNNAAARLKLGEAARAPLPVLAAMARLELASVVYFEDAAAADEILAREERLFEGQNYHHHLARIGHLRGLASAAAGDWLGAAERFSESSLRYAQSGDLASSDQLAAFEAQSRARLGDLASTWNVLNEVLPRLSRGKRRPLYHNALVALHDVLSELRLDYAASWVGHELILNATEEDNSHLLAEALAKHAGSLAETGQLEEARELATRAIDVAVTAGVAPEIAALHRLDLARLLAGTHADQALQTIQQVLSLSRANGWEELTSRARLVEASAHALLGDLEGARKALQAEPALADHNLTPSNGSTNFSRARRRALELIVFAGLRLDSAPSRDLIRFARIARGESAEPRVDSTSLPATSDSPHRPDRVVDAEYLVLPDRVLVWTTTDGGRLNQYESEVDARSLAESVESARLLLATGRDSPGLRRLLRRLWDLLVAPYATHLDQNRRLRLSLDGSLGALPFAALLDPQGRHLVETVEPVVLLPTSRASNRERPAEASVLLLQASTEQARELLEPSRELAAVTRFYDLPVLVPKSLARARVLSPSADIVHIAAHAVFNPTRPGLSSLVLDADQPLELTASQLSEWELGASLVFFSACGPVEAPIDSWTDVNPLARAALRAGSHEVVAALLPITDSSASKLAESFHRYYADSRDAVRALTEAQRLQISEPGADLRWASFVSYRAEG